MCDRVDVWRMSFILPERIAALVSAGRVTPCLHGCRLDIESFGRSLQAVILAPSRERAFDQARRYLAGWRRGKPYRLCASVRAPRSVDGRGGSDTVWITVGAVIVFSDQPHPPAAFVPQRAVGCEPGELPFEDNLVDLRALPETA